MKPYKQGHCGGITCTKCDFGCATTCFPKMEKDSTNYEIYLQPNNVVSRENIKIISKIANLNYLESKKVLESKTAC